MAVGEDAGKVEEGDGMALRHERKYDEMWG